MRFAAPALLWLLLLLPVLGLASWLAAIARRRSLERFAGGAAHAARFTETISQNRRAIKVLLLLLAIGAGITALARPQWGTRLEPIARRGVDVVFVIDTSRSMSAEDVAPNRIGQARHAAASLIKALASERVALVTFAGRGTLTCPLTVDHEAALLFLDTIDVDLIPVQGSSISEAIRVASRSFGPAGGEGRYRAIVLLSDGEDHEGQIDEAIGAVKQAKATVYAIGCGTVHGSPIPVREASGASAGYKKDAEGKVVTTRLNEELMEKLALDTEGGYYRATPSEVEVEEIAKAIAGMDQKEYGTVLKTRYEERYQFPLGLALLALAGETVLGDRRGSRRGSREKPVVSS